jgi:small subunit ribosomal protein S7
MLPLNPILYLTLAIDSVAPLMRIRNQRGAAGGGVALQIPAPLGEKQRRRTVLKWILDAAEKKQSGGGKGALAKKIADEIVSIAEGRSQVWNKRDLVHKMGVSARANVKWAMMQKR